jgi:hypothetical protein
MNHSARLLAFGVFASLSDCSFAAAPAELECISDNKAEIFYVTFSGTNQIRIGGKVLPITGVEINQASYRFLDPYIATDCAGHEEQTIISRQSGRYVRSVFNSGACNAMSTNLTDGWHAGTCKLVQAPKL